MKIKIRQAKYEDISKILNIEDKVWEKKKNFQ